jgi:hypothetical protein
MLLQDDTRTDYFVDAVDYEDKSGEQLYPTEFLHSLSPSGLPQHKLNLKNNTIVMFFVLQQLKLYSMTNVIKIAFSMVVNKIQGQTFNRLGIHLPHSVFSHGQFYVVFFRASS